MKFFKYTVVVFVLFMVGCSQTQERVESQYDEDFRIINEEQPAQHQNTHALQREKAYGLKTLCHT